MCFHPAYPTAADLSREADAEDRDLADLVALRELRAIVSDALDRAARCDTIRHPDTVDHRGLLEALQGALADIDGTAAMIRRSPLVLEEAA